MILQAVLLIVWSCGLTQSGYSPLSLSAKLDFHSALSDTRIIGGMDAPDHAYPHQVSLQRNPGNLTHFCGGSIISEQFVITAGHCVHGKEPEGVIVLAGTNSRSDPGVDNGGDGVYIECAEFFSHPEFSINTMYADVALIKLRKRITFGDTIQPIELPEVDQPDPISVTVSGWGYTDYKDKVLPDRLQHLDLRTFDVKQCDSYMIQWRVGKCHVCTRAPLGYGVCNGDSGGPLIDDKGILLGLVSFGVPCARSFPDAYCRVSCFTKWIREVVNENTDNNLAG